MTTRNTDYKTVEYEQSGMTYIITFSDSMKETIIRDPDGKETADFTPINMHELDRLNALYDSVNYFPEEIEELDGISNLRDNTRDDRDSIEIER